jgi:hypothetical protein
MDYLPIWTQYLISFVGGGMAGCLIALPLVAIFCIAFKAGTRMIEYLEKKGWA